EIRRGIEARRRWGGGGAPVGVGRGFRGGGGYTAPAERTHRRLKDASSQEGTQEKEPPRKDAGAGQGVLRNQVQVVPHGQTPGREVAGLRLSRPQGEEARLPRALDRADQRRGAGARA